MDTLLAWWQQLPPQWAFLMLLPAWVAGLGAVRALWDARANV